jgi:hypothetical protein
MAIISEKIEGTKILNEIESSNINQTIYDTKTQNLEVTFKNGLVYSYEEWLNHKDLFLIKKSPKLLNIIKNEFNQSGC